MDTLHSTAHKNTPPTLWPEEPKTPAEVDDKRFVDALERLCGSHLKNRVKRVSKSILEEARRFDIDPFILAALVYDQSRCWSGTPKRDARLGRFGLTRIPVEMHKPHIRAGQYRYYVKDADTWKQLALDIEKYPFNKYKAKKSEANLYFAGALLKLFTRQGHSLDAAFRSVDHRHAISHWFYGDRVANVEPENRVLTARRRILQYYHGTDVTRAGEYNGKKLVSPLDGVPRLVIDYFGNPRDKKRRSGHRGIDIDGALGEPVRAIADGKVVFAGVDIPGPGASQQLGPLEAAEFPRGDLGPGGIYVSINHGDGFGTLYMHLDSIKVAYRDEVHAGDIIGTLGRSGTDTSGPHLHLEFRKEMTRVDPATPLSTVLVNPYIK